MTLREIFADFFDTTSAQGFGHIFNSTRPWFDRAFWALCTLAAWCAMLYFACVMVIDYKKYPADTAVALEYKKDTAFPAVTICNMNPIAFSKLKDLASISNSAYDDVRQLVQILNDTIQEVSADEAQSSAAAHNASTDGALQRMVQTTLYPLGNQVMATYGVKLEDMLLDCTYQGFTCTPKNFTQWQHGTYGNCYTMVVNATEFPGSLTGPQFGLQMQLFVQSAEYLPRAAPIVGMRVALHPSDVTPFLEEEGYTISTGSYAAISMNKLEITRLPAPYDGKDCLSKDDKRINDLDAYKNMAKLLNASGYPVDKLQYTFTACVKSCYENLTSHLCDCVDPASITLGLAATEDQFKNKRACDFGEMKSSKDHQCLIQQVQPVAANTCGSLCEQPCDQTNYQGKVSAAMWPSNNYIKLAMKKWTSKVPALANAITSVVPPFLLQSASDFDTIAAANAVFEQLQDVVNAIPNILPPSPLAVSTPIGVPNTPIPISVPPLTEPQGLTNLPVTTPTIPTIPTIPTLPTTAAIVTPAAVPNPGSAPPPSPGLNGRRKRQSDDADDEKMPKEVARGLADFYVQNLIRQELVGVSVFFEELNVQSITQSPKYQLWDVISNTGGIFGLFIGITLLTAVEVVLLLKDLIMFFVLRNRRETAEGVNDHELTATAHTNGDLKHKDTV